MNEDVKERIKEIKILLLDVDGVLTTGMVNIFGDDTEMYTFNVYDGYGIKLWRRAGFKVGFLTGRCSDAVKYRAKKLGVDFLFRGVEDKVAVCEGLLKKEEVTFSEIAFVGDDLQDLALLKKVGFSVAPANARKEIMSHAHYVSPLNGGDGAVREIIEYILKAKGLWESIESQDRFLS